MSELPGIDVKAMKARLLDRRRELGELLDRTAEDRQVVELDQTRVGRLSRMDALQSQAMSLETTRRRRAELQRIDAALRRMDEDEYGFCLGCGEAIAAKRLELDPAISVCIDCAAGSRY